MKATVNKWGNSLAIRIPQYVAEKLGLTEGTTVDIDATAEAITIVRRKLSLESLLATYDSPEQEIDWGTKQGKEAW